METEVNGIGNDVVGKGPELDVKTIKRSTSIEEIKHELTDEEKTKKGSEIARIHRKVQLLEEEKKQSADHYGGLIKEEKLLLNRCADAVNTGYEFRSTSVETIIDYKAGTVTKYRKDTGEEIEHRRMNNAEARIEIEITDKSSKAVTLLPEYTESDAKKDDEKTAKKKRGTKKA